MRPVFFILFLIWMTLSGCESEVVSQTTSEFAVGERLAELTDERLDEASGLVASRSNPGRLWILNDGGNEPELYLVDQDLKVIMTVRLHDVANRDWEDIAIGAGPDPSKTYIYVGDIGDNLGVFSHKYIYRFPEPKFGSEDAITILDFDKITFELEDEGMKDFESLLIDPKSKNLYIISKREFPASVYELPYSATSEDTVTGIKVLTLPMISLVAADCFEKTGDILMKNYTNIYFWENKDNLDVISLLKKTPQGIPYESEPQGESIGWAADGSGFFTLSEKPADQRAYLYFYLRK